MTQDETQQQQRPRSIATPPQLHFDDGSRAMGGGIAMTSLDEINYPHHQEEEVEVVDDDEVEETTKLLRDSSMVDITTYYELHRWTTEICTMVHRLSTSSSSSIPFKVALQFPDELLPDAPEVCWLLEELIQEELKRTTSTPSNPEQEPQQSIMQPVQPLIFVLGDTTVASCCPDIVAAQHLQADLLIHYGPACWSSHYFHHLHNNNTTTEVEAEAEAKKDTTSTSISKIPIVGYSLGCPLMDIQLAVQTILQQLKEEDNNNTGSQQLQSRRILLLYDPMYYGHIEELQTSLSEQGDILVVAGQVPEIAISSPSMYWYPSTSTSTLQKSNNDDTVCCGGGGDGGNGGNCHPPTTEATTMATHHDDQELPATSSSSSLKDPSERKENKEEEERNASHDHDDHGHHQQHPLVVGGLELPDTITSWDQLSDFVILYIGNNNNTNDTTTNMSSSSKPTSRQHITILLRLLSLPNPPQHFWTYCPPNNRSTSSNTSSLLSTSIPSSIQQQLKRRFYLTQKARSANVFGILINSHVTQTISCTTQNNQYSIGSTIRKLQHRIQQHAANEEVAACYSLAVGKITPTKLANFPEIDCFILLSCEQTSLLENEREYHVPVITPLELEIVLGNFEWGERIYSLQMEDTLFSTSNNVDETNTTKNDLETNHDYDNDEEDHNDDDDDDDDDAPYFSMVTGKYETSRSSHKKQQQPLDLKALPGQGQVLVYQSEAANFLKQRDYQGLEPQLGQTEAKPATLGQKGIASEYEGI